MHVLARLTKVDEEKRLVFGRIAEEAPDKSGEVMDYASSRPHFESWSAEVAKDSGGKSLGNVRAMHGKVAAGLLTGIDFNDAEKAIDVSAKIVDDAEWKKVLEGVYTGFSIGGRYVGAKTVEKMVDGTEVKRYTAAPSEVSLVDRPCMPGARFFDVQKADGSLVKAEFAAKDEAAEGEEKPEGEADEKADAKDAKADAKDDAEKIDAADDVEVKGSTEDVLALGKAMNAEGLAVADLLAMLAERKAAAEAAVEKVDTPAVPLRKSLYGCGSFIGVITALADLKRSTEYEAMYEGDPEDKAIADELRACIAMCGSVVQRMLAHELGELTGGAEGGMVELAEKAGALAKADDAEADPLLDLLKIGARNSAADAGRLAKIHALINELGHPCAVVKAEPEADLQKAEALAAERVAPLQKALDAALERIGRLERQPAPATIRLRAVEKAHDVALPGQQAEAEPEPVLDGMGKAHDAATLIKSLHATGGQALMKVR